MSWPQVKESSFWSVIFCYSMQQQWTISQLDCDVWRKLDFTWQPVMTSLSLLWLDWEEASKHFPKINMHQNGVMVTIGGPLHLSESWLSHYIREACSANQWDAPKPTTPEAGTGQQNWPNSSLWQHTTCCTTNPSKIELIGLQSFASSAIFTWPLNNRQPLLQASQQFFCRENAYTTRREQKMFPRVHWIMKHKFLCYKSKQTYFSLTNMCWL